MHLPAKMHPADHMSMLVVYSLAPKRTSGGRYHKVTTSAETNRINITNLCKTYKFYFYHQHLGFIKFLVKSRARSNEFQNLTFSKNAEIIQIKMHVESGF